MKKIANLDPFDKNTIKNEPMVYSASPAFAYKNGGVITKEVLERLFPYIIEETNVVIDTRVHMLKPGWFPSIPGWHCDAIPRDKNKVPDLDHPSIPDIEHYLFLADFETGSLTEFLCETPDLPKKVDPKLYKEENLWGLHSRLIKEQNLSSYKVTNNTIYKFDAMDYHNTVPATGHGFRYFFRASVNTQTNGPYNEVRRQVQTYLPYEDLGW